MYLLFRYALSLKNVQAVKVYLTCGIVILIYVVEDSPGDVPLNTHLLLLELSHSYFLLWAEVTVLHKLFFGLGISCISLHIIL